MERISIVPRVDRDRYEPRWTPSGLGDEEISARARSGPRHDHVTSRARTRQRNEYSLDHDVGLLLVGHFKAIGRERKASVKLREVARAFSGRAAAGTGDGVQRR